MENPNELLVNLVRALDGAYWSSWQQTASFSKELDAARQYVDKITGQAQENTKP